MSGPPATPHLGAAAVTLGVFDGVHVGHRQLLRETVRAAEERDALPVAVVFVPHPDEVVKPGTRVPRLLPPDETLHRLEGVGVRPVVVAFDERVRGMAPEEFLDSLGSGMEIRAVTMTTGSAFGKGRSGTVDRVREIGAAEGFDLVEVDPLLLDGEPVSSTRTRQALADGDLELVDRLLSGSSLLRGSVVRGDGRGRELGYPTANLAFGYTPALPRLGIYLGRVSVPVRGVGPGHPALVSVGVRPTFGDDGAVLVEAYLLDWDGDLYGTDLDVELTHRLRDERRFDSVDALVAQMSDDEALARGLLGGRPGAEAGQAG